MVNRFLAGSFYDVTASEWAGLVGVSLTGLLCIYLEIKSLGMIPPSVFATLRTSQVPMCHTAYVVAHKDYFRDFRPSRISFAMSGELG